MMSEKQVEQDIKADLQKTGSGNGQVIYLEGKTDPEVFFGLLGVPVPRDGVHQQTLVKGLREDDWGSGNEAVQRNVQVAQAVGIGAHVFGIIDGDGASWASLVAQFDRPHPGPLFAWKAYSIESLLPQADWPAGWGPAPNWVAELDRYAPYAGLNVLSRKLNQALKALDIHTLTNPIAGQPIRAEGDILAVLQAGQQNLTGRDLAAEFTAEVANVRAAFASSLPEGLGLMNGKWLLTHFLPLRPATLNRRQDVLRREWANHATAVGGLVEVRDLWTRITGSPP